MSTSTVRLTVAQAIVRFLEAQQVSRDGRSQRFFAGALGIFGHGNVAGLGQALQQSPEFPYTLVRNEQAAVHLAAGFARMSNRLRTYACVSSIGPGATNMITGAAGATVNRIPVLLLPGDIFARRNVAPVLQQLESPATQDIGVNDCFKPVSRYWDRIYRPEQILTSLPEAMRVLTSPADTGAVTLALPQDVQSEAYDFPAAFFETRTWYVPRQPADRGALARAAAAIRTARRPIIVAGGGVIYAEATEALARFVEATGIPVGETQAGKGTLPYDHPSCLGSIGATGTLAANRIARDADLVIGIGTRYTDFTTASQTLFQNPDVRFVNINVAEFDAFKQAALPVVGDARVALEELAAALEGYHVAVEMTAEIAQLRSAWAAEVERLYHLDHQPLPAQSEVIGALWAATGPRDVLVSAAGSHPGDLHKLWRPSDPKGYHLEYGYSCMGYEIPGALGVKMADPSREVYVIVGDGTYLMMPSEIATSVQEGYKLIIVLIDNHGFGSIGSLSRTVGSGGFGTRYRYRSESGQLDGDVLKVDFAANARSLGAAVFSAHIDCRTAHRPGRSQGRRPHRCGGGGDRPRGGRTGVRIVVGRAGGRGLGERDGARRRVSSTRNSAATSGTFSERLTQPGGGGTTMSTIRVGNAPCSWGSLEFAEVSGGSAPYRQVLDEIAAAGYSGTELGDWGFMPTEPERLRAELSARGLDMLGAFVPVALSDPAAHAGGVETALRAARLLAAVAPTDGPAPLLVLADDNGTVAARTANAGRITPGMGLDCAGWRSLARGALAVAAAVFDETGLRTAFHHHCGGYVETPDEIARLLDLTPPERLGLVLDTGHYAYGCGPDQDHHVGTALARFGERIAYVHLKDYAPEVGARARAEGWDYFRALRAGVFCELGPR